MRTPSGRIFLGFIFVCSQLTVSLTRAAVPKANNCAEALILVAAKKNVRDVYNNRPNGGGVCALGVRQSLQLSKVGGVNGPLGNAIDYINSMPPHGFVDSGLRDPKKAPIGSVLVFSGPKSAEYLRTGKFGTPVGDWVGHVTIKGDDGYYYTDGRTAEPANGWSNDRNTAKTRNMAAIFVAGPELIEEFKGKCAKLALEMDELMLTKNLALISMLVSAQPAMAASNISTINCKGCEATVNLQRETAQLNYAKKSDRNKGRKSVEPALEQFRSFSTLQETDETRPDRFDNLVAMAREVVPYDVEGQVAQSLAQIIAKNGSLTSRFNRMVDLMNRETPAERCKTKALQSLVRENLCLKSAGLKGQDHHQDNANSANHCIEAFNFEHCLLPK